MLPFLMEAVVCAMVFVFFVSSDGCMGNEAALCVLTRGVWDALQAIMRLRCNPDDHHLAPFAPLVLLQSDHS